MKKQEYIHNELLKTLAYSDIFQYPLSGDQLFRFVGIHISRKDFFAGIKRLPFLSINNTIYYFLPHKKHIVAERLLREKISRKKMLHVVKIAKLLGMIPSIRFIGISGSLALMNASLQDDSDIFIITSRHTVWLTRLLIYFLLSMLGVKKTKRKNPNAICANMFVDVSRLQIDIKKRNMYTAHEIVQIVPVINKNKTWQQFLLKNSWVKKYFPNMIFPKKMEKNSSSFFAAFLYPLEYVVMQVQMAYMKNKITREIVTPTYIAFHPVDYESLILSAYNKKAKQYGI